MRLLNQPISMGKQIMTYSSELKYILQSRMCFLKHSTSAWGKKKSLWHRPSMDLEGVIYLETSTAEERKKHFEQVDVMN